jgi:putative spermidine/putrescine transport system substrate-binding protein
MLRNSIFASIIAAAISVTPAFAESITVQSWGTTWETGLNDIASSFTKETGIEVIPLSQASSTEGLVKLQGMRDNPQIDVWFTTASVAARAETDNKLFSKIDPAALKNAGGLINGARTDYWVAAYYYPLSIVYRPDLVSEPIKEWADLWDPKFKNKLALPSIEMYQARMLLVSALINKGDVDHIDSGFDKLKELAPNAAMWYPSDSDARRAIATGEAVAVVGPPLYAQMLKDDGLPAAIVSPTPSPVMFDVMMLLNTPRKEAAQKFIDYVIGVKSQEIFSKLYEAPVNVKAEPAPEFAKVLPAEKNQVVFDERKINSQINSWTERFHGEVAK